ncbi:uncharacterized protein LOC119728740 [Patiria miniata]|uniref:Uncharacterized protein n=1 Tax=Patiria miniata TaxID=46514 RepID=A0A913ZZM4_PATMI|nr:uncharacterized protein LOC119728740 [Patiria miniata]
MAGMEGDDRWATPVQRPRPVSSQRVRRYSIPAGLYSTKTELQLDERAGFLGNTAADYENHEANHHPYAATTGRRLRAYSERAYSKGKAAYREIKTEDRRESANQRRAQSKSFSSGDLVRGEGLDKHRSIVRRRSVSDDSQESSHGVDNSTSPSLTESGKHLYPHRPVIMQVAEETLPGSRERRRPGSLLKQRERTPALNVDDGAMRHAHNHVLSSLSSSSRVNTVSDTSHGDSSENISPRPPNSSANHRRTRRLSSAGESASSPVPTLGSNLREVSSGRSRRKSTSVLPSITHSSPASNAGMATPQPPPYSQHGPGSRKGLAAGAGGLQSRSLPEEKLDDEEDVNAVHADLLLLTRKKKISSNVSDEYRLALDDLKIAPSKKPTPPVGKRLLSKRWSSLQTSVLAKNNGDLGGTVGKDQSSTVGGSGDMPKDGKLQHTDDTNNNELSEPRRHRGWEIVRAKLTTIADMAPKDSIDSKPLTFRNIADLVKAKEFRLMMKRRASFIENGRFQFDEAKQDLYRRYGGRPAGNLAPTAPSESHNNHGRKTDGGTGTRVVNRRKLLGLSGSL